MDKKEEMKEFDTQKDNAQQQEIVQQNENQNKEDDKEKDQFEGEMSMEFDYKLSTENLLEGLNYSAQSKKDLKHRITIISLILLIIAGIVIIFMSKIIAGASCILLGLFLIFQKEITPMNYRKKVSKIIGERNDEYKVIFYETGIRIIENQKSNDIKYENLIFKELTNVMVLMFGQLVIVLPKEYFGDKLPDIKKLLKHTVKEYRD